VPKPAHKSNKWIKPKNFKNKGANANSVKLAALLAENAALKLQLQNLQMVSPQVSGLSPRTSPNPTPSFPPSFVPQSPRTADMVPIPTVMEASVSKSNPALVAAPVVTTPKGARVGPDVVLIQPSSTPLLGDNSDGAIFSQNLTGAGESSFGGNDTNLYSLRYYS
jgi:hypothetical protein